MSEDRKALPVEYVARIHKAAKKATGSVIRRREWPDSEWSSPVVILMLCAEIARLNIELEKNGN